MFVKGSGQPLCVTHLYSEFNDSGDYFAETFTDLHRVYLVNLRETGRSEKAAEPHQLSMFESVLDLEAIRDMLGYKKWGFAGHSTGGMLGVLYSIYFSEHLYFQLIVGAAAREYMTFSDQCIYNENHPDFAFMQSLIEKLKRKDLSETRRKELTIERTKLSLYKPEAYEQLFNDRVHKTMSAVRMNYFVRELPIFDVTHKLQLIDTSVLIMCGKHDVQCPLEYSLEMNEHISGCKLVVFEDSNHYPFLEEPTKFKQAVQQFVSEIREPDDAKS
ncbi:alpha/beta hydrolase [Halobacillus shinanisalinarum]|uniref:Alpha/beta hydrolase n=1 Tax=Halobacillus shinanisalinarum TaxID=2932258 RepID=A0ABY4H5B3_9BACI|nr:alpha/beta hydrolase [Halobacillus shinanisalinarum]UOQ95343.1 alpha/beta hydrolase [Halobacillus shinanisalinarum]